MPSEVPVKTHDIAANDVVFTESLPVVFEFAVGGFLSSSTIAIRERFFS